MTRRTGRIHGVKTTASRIATWSALVAAVILTALLTGVGLAAVLAGRGGATRWQTYSDVGQTFGVLSSIISSLALLAVVATARQNSKELERQRLSQAKSDTTLRNTSHANLGMLHQQLIKMSIDDEELAAVWPAIDLASSAATNRQCLYANLIYVLQVRALDSDVHSETSVIQSLRYLFSSPIMRAYWSATRDARLQLDPQSTEYRLARHVDDICATFDEGATQPT